MKSIKKYITQLLLDSSKQAFNFPMTQPTVGINNNLDYSTRFPLELYEKHRYHMDKYWGKNQLSPQQIAQEILFLIPYTNEIQKQSATGLGHIEFQISNQFYEEQIKFILKNEQNFLSIVPNDLQYAVIYPFTEIAQASSIQWLRGINISETYGRIMELNGCEVYRISSILNYSSIHGIIASYLQSKKIQVGDQVQMNNLAAFVSELNLDNLKDIQEYGNSQLRKAQIDDELKQIFDGLNQSQIQNQQLIFSKFLPNGRQFESLRQDIIQKNTEKHFQELMRNGIVQINESKLYYFTKGKELVYLTDLTGCNFLILIYQALTSQGFLVIYLKEILYTKNIDQFFFSSSINDEQLYGQMQILFQNIVFWQHSDIYYQTDKTKLTSVLEFFEQLILMNIVKAKENFPKLDHSQIESQAPVFLDQSIGWLRYLDHKKQRKVPYILDVEQIVNFMYKNDQIINSRLYLSELIQSYPHQEQISIQNFKIIDGADRQICQILIQFPDTVQESLEKNDFSLLTIYLESLINLIEKQKIDKKFIKKSEYDSTVLGNDLYYYNKKLLMQATLNVLSKLFFILGIIN